MKLKFPPTPWAPAPPSPKRTGPPVCRHPICGTVAEGEVFKWPHVFDLCTLGLNDVRLYEWSHFWMALAIEPILKWDPKYKSRTGWKWKEVFEAFQRRNETWNPIRKPSSLA